MVLGDPSQDGTMPFCVELDPESVTRHRASVANLLIGWANLAGLTPIHRTEAPSVGNCAVIQ